MTEAGGAALEAAAAERILVLDGAMGTMIQQLGLEEADFRGARFADWPQDVKGNNDLLSLTLPDAIADIHNTFLDAGADILETNSFNATRVALADYGMEGLAREINEAAARIARAAVDGRRDGRPRWVAGAIGPTNRTASISPDVEDPAARNIDFDTLRAAYREAAEGLIDGGADLLIVETVFDTLNAKAALYAVEEVFEARGRLPAGDRLRHGGGPFGPHALRTDAGGLLVFRAPCAALRRRPQLRARRGADARLPRRHGARRGHAHFRLSQCRPAQRLRRL